MSERLNDTGPLEAVYDAEIAPLMAQVIAICKRESIGMLCTFELDGDAADPLRCTTAMQARSKSLKMATDLILTGFTAYTVTARAAVKDRHE